MLWVIRDLAWSLFENPQLFLIEVNRDRNLGRLSIPVLHCFLDLNLEIANCTRKNHLISFEIRHRAKRHEGAKVCLPTLPADLFIPDSELCAEVILDFSDLFLQEIVALLDDVPDILIGQLGEFVKLKTGISVML